MDLSYRAQMAGWKFVFLPRLACPAELPPEINAFKSQQHRWTKGSIQTAIKLLPTMLRSKASPRIKLEAFFHLTSPMVYLYITLLALLFYPAIYVNVSEVDKSGFVGLVLGITFFVLGTISATVFYLASQRAQQRSGWGTLLQVPLLMSIGIGIALNNAVACLEALLGYESPFVRTPKYNRSGNAADKRKKKPAGDKATAAAATKKRVKDKLPLIPLPSVKRSISFLEIAMGLYMIECIRLSIVNENTVVSLPFLVLFASGYFYVGATSLWMHVRSHFATREAAAQAT